MDYAAHLGAPRKPVKKAVCVAVGYANSPRELNLRLHGTHKDPHNLRNLLHSTELLQLLWCYLLTVLFRRPDYAFRALWISQQKYQSPNGSLAWQWPCTSTSWHLSQPRKYCQSRQMIRVYVAKKTFRSMLSRTLLRTHDRETTSSSFVCPSPVLRDSASGIWFRSV